MPQPIIEIALGANDAYSLPLAVTIYSVLASYESNGNVPHRLRFWIFDSRIATANKQRIEQIASRFESCLEIEWLQPDLSVFP
jgi:lipopolysaccharide biosynthesis glycosyltransferase